MSTLRSRLPHPVQPMSPPGPGHRLSLGAALCLLSLAACALAAVGAMWLAAGLGVAAPWAALCGAVLGVVAVVLPAALLTLRLPRPAPAFRSGQRAAAGLAATAGTPRPLFLQWAEREWARARRHDTGMALLLVDIDRYLRLCELRGGEAGASVLGELLRSTTGQLRAADLSTQYGEGQLAILLSPADATGALDVAERIRERAERLNLRWAGQPLCISVSVGVAYLRPVHPHLQALADDAKDALVVARQAGGNCVRAAPLESERARQPGSWRGDRRTPRRQPRP